MASLGFFSVGTCDGDMVSMMVEGTRHGVPGVF